MSRYNEMKRPVSNRGVPPDAFLDEIIRWGRMAPAWVFAPNNRHDVYSSVEPQLGPWRSTEHRRAVMLEVMRVLAGFESSWNWREGVDTTNATSNTPETEETGAFQVSANSMMIDKSLRDYVRLCLGDVSPEAFILGMKQKPQLAIGYVARLLRFTVNHNGPVKRLEINQYLSRESVQEIEKILNEKPSSPARPVV